MQSMLLLFLGRCRWEFKCFSDTIRLQFEVLLKPFSSGLSRSQNHTDKKTDKQTDRQNPHGQNGRIAPYWKAGNQLTRDHYQLGDGNQLESKRYFILYLDY